MEKGALIGQGRTADVYAWGNDRILKLYQTHMPVHLVEQEYQRTQAALAAALPVPETEDLVEVDGRPGIIFERLEGPSMLKTMSAQPWRLPYLAGLLGELHARVHKCVAGPEFPSQRQQIERGIAAAKGLEESIREACYLRLAKLPQENFICHGDFHPDNILITSRGPVIIDWMTATKGTPLADVCRTSLILRTGGLPPGSPLHVRLLLNTLRIFIDRIYQRRYFQGKPAARQNIKDWQLPLLAERLCEIEQYPAEKQLVLTRIQAAL